MRGKCYLTSGWEALEDIVHDLQKVRSEEMRELLYLCLYKQVENIWFLRSAIREYLCKQSETGGES